MSRTTAQAFAAFLETISPSEAQEETIRTKRGATEGYLKAAFPASSDMPLKRVILIGSAAKNTLVRPVDDLDVMAQFINEDNVFEKYRYDSCAFLDRIRLALDAQTSIQKIGSRGQAVRLFYQDGIHVDIAPVFKWSSSGYALPAGDGSWITTDPEQQAAWLSARRQEVGYNLGPVIRLAKRWNNVHSKRFKSFHLEVMIATMFASVGSDHRGAMKIFFEKAPYWFAVSDPAGHSGALDSYLSWSDKETIKSRFSQALERATRAIAAEKDGDHDEAKRLWHIELGDEFPTG